VRYGILLAVIVALIVLASIAGADTLRLANGSTVSGAITEIKLKIGPIDKVLLRDSIRSIAFDKKRWQVVGSDGTRYVGTLNSVAILATAGELSFGGNSIREIDLENREAAPGAAPVPPVPAATKDDKAKGAGTTTEPGRAAVVLAREAPDKPLSPEQKKRLQDLVKRAGELRDAALAQVDKLAQTDYNGIRSDYQDKWKAACDEVDARKREYARYADTMVDTTPGSGKRQVTGSGLGIGIGRTKSVVPVSGPAADAYKALGEAELRRDQLATVIRGLKSAVADKANLRRERVRTYYLAIYRDLTAGKEIPEDAMDKIFDQAVTGVK
jgi:hypothetical protein